MKGEGRCVASRRTLLGAGSARRGGWRLAGEAGGISIGTLVLLAVMVLTWHVGIQAVQGAYGWFKMTNLLEEAIAVARLSLGPSQGPDPRQALQTRLASGAIEAGVPLEAGSVLLESAGEGLLLRVWWEVPLVVRVELYRLPFEVSKFLPPGDSLAKWFLDNPAPVPRRLPRPRRFGRPWSPPPPR